MRKRLLSFIAFAVLGSALHAQVATGVVPPSSLLENESVRQNLNLSPTRNFTSPSSPVLLPLGTACTGSDLLGSSSNMFTIGLTESSAIAVDNDIQTVLFLHRNNATAFGGSSGHLRYSLSTNNGVSWTNNQGPVNPLVTNAARYPNVAIYNPPGNTNPNNAYLSYFAPALLGAGWGNHVMGVRKLDGTGNTENYNQAGTFQNYIPRSMVKGDSNTFWAVEVMYSGTAFTGFRVLKGAWNGVNDVTWSINTTLSTPFNTTYSGANQISDVAIGFDPTGQKGWVCALTHTTPGPTNFAFYPNFWKTTNGGISWSGPEQVNLAQYPCIMSGITAPNVPTACFDVDLTVDYLGNPHAVMAIGNGNNAYAVFYTSWHHMFDITLEHGVWNAVDLANVNNGRGTFGTAPNQLSMDMEPQASRTDDGTKVFFTWTGSDAVALGTANTTPNLFGMAYDVVNREWTTMRSFSNCNVATTGKIFFPKMAENAINLLSGGWELPVIYGEFTVGTDPAAISNFRYLDSLTFTNSDFVNVQCTAAVSINQGDTVTVCQGAGGTVSITGIYDDIRWSNGGTTTSINVNTAGWLYVGARSGCCVGVDSIFVILDSLPVANYSASTNLLTADFTDLTAGNPTLWVWDFGDGNTSTLQNPQHIYATLGTYTVCLIATDLCASDTICDTVAITCPAPVSNFAVTDSFYTFTFSDSSLGNPGITYSWDFGDGNTSTAQSPQHVYAGIGTYNVCLIVTDVCGSDTLCQQVTATCPGPDPSFTYNSLNLTADFTNTSPSSVSVTWDFGDGNNSTAANPSHTYTSVGTYLVCLTVTDSCGTDSVCQNLTLVCVNPQAGFSTTPGVNGEVTFNNQTNPVADNYSWDFGDGGTSTLSDPSHTYTASGTYTVCLYTSDTCGTDTFCTNVTVTVVGTENPLAGNINVYPNPTNDNFIVKIEIPGLENLNLELVNMLGQQLWRREQVSGNGICEIPAEQLAPGVYLLQASSGDQSITIKLLKK